MSSSKKDKQNIIKSPEIPQNPIPLFQTKSTNSILVLCLSIPSSFLVFLGPKLSYQFGFEKTLKIFALLFLISPLFTQISFNLYMVFLFFYMLPLTAFEIGSISLFNCLWSHFPESLGRVTGMSLFFFGFGEVVWGILLSFLVNPENRTATINDP